MKLLWQILILLSVFVTTLFIAFACAGILDQYMMLYPTPKSESVFLKKYTPQSVIESFESGQFNSSSEKGEGAGAGRRFVTHEHTYASTFAIQSEKRIPLMNALSEDIYAQLVNDGASVISRNGDPQVGFHFVYRLGKNTGTVTLSPIASAAIHRNMPLPEGIADMTLKIAVAEKWFPKEADAMQASLSLH